MIPLFDSDSSQRSQEQLEDGAMLLRGFAAAEAQVLVDEVARIAETAAFRHMVTPGGYTMSVAMTNCGHLGWVSDRTGYRYTPVDPDTGAPWPAMPAPFIDIAVRAAAEAGFANYDPDACLINRYIAGANSVFIRTVTRRMLGLRSSPCRSAYMTLCFIGYSPCWICVCLIALLPLPAPSSAARSHQIPGATQRSREPAFS
jgi:hypothetical protein